MAREGRFEQLLSSARGGVVSADLNDKLRQVVAAVQQTGKKGKVTLEITIEHKGKSKSGSEKIQLIPRVKTSEPAPAPEELMFFIDDAGDLSREDPNQPSIPGLRAVKGGD